MDSTHGDAAMIDPADKQTESLALEPQKRGRGRPSTGQAMTPAEKQKAYRERQKSQKPNAVAAKVEFEVGEKARNQVRELERQLTGAKAETAAAIARAEEAEANFVTLRKKLDKALATIQETKNSNVTDLEADGMWTVQRREPGKKAWTSSELETFRSAKDSVDYMQFKSGSGQQNTWRAVRADGMMYWPKAPK